MLHPYDILQDNVLNNEMLLVLLIVALVAFSLGLVSLLRIS